MFGSFNGQSFYPNNLNIPSKIVRSTRTASVPLAPWDIGTLIDITSGTFSQKFTDAALLGSGWFVYIRNSGTGVLTLAPTQSIDGATTLTLQGGQQVLVQCDGSNFYTPLRSQGSMQLLATLTPTAVANVDALTTFTATYDSYVITGQALGPASSDSLAFQFAAAGSADSGSNYYRTQISTSGGIATTAASTSGLVILGDTTSGVGYGNFELRVKNANFAAAIKSAVAECVSETAVTPGYRGETLTTAYAANNAITGIRFFWSSGANFVAQGKIRIYGISN